MAHTETTKETKERLKYCAYRHTWPRRSKLTPKGEETKGPGGQTWGEWFLQMHGEPIEAYHARLAQKATAEAAQNKERSAQASREAQRRIMESLKG